MKNYLGIDIGGTAVKLGIVDELGNISHTAQYPVAFDAYETPILDTVLKSCRIFLDDIQIAASALSGIGVSATGQIDSVSGTVAGVGGNIKNWEGSRIKDELEAEFGLETTVVNDANCVAIGEQWIGSAKDVSDVIVLTVGTGLGGGIIVNNRILLGQSGFGGELGHFSIAKHGRQCTCGNTGCFEQYASMTALIKSVNESCPGMLNPVNGKTIFDAVKAGNPQISSVLENWISDIAEGIISLVHIFNPRLIVIGGGVSVQKELFIERLETKVLAGVMPNFRKNLSLKAAALGNNAGLAGAVYYFINNHKGAK